VINKKNKIKKEKKKNNSLLKRLKSLINWDE
jgi:hypothetical protein